MITVFKKIWNFAEKEQPNIQKSIIVGFLCAAFNAMQMGGVYYVLVKIFDETLSMKDIAIVLGILLVSLVGKIITQYIYLSWSKRMPAILWRRIKESVSVTSLKKYRWDFSVNSA